MSDLEPLLFRVGLSCLFCAGQLFVIGFILVIARIRGQGESAWKTMAAKYGLTYQTDGFMSYGYGTMSGKIDGEDVTFRCYSTRARHSVTWTVVSIPVGNTKNLTLSIGAKGMEGSIFKALGAEDITIGLSDFDDRFTIQSNPPGLAPKILLADTNLRAAISAVSPYELQFKDTTASCRVLGPQKEEAVLLNLLRLTRQIADSVEANG